MKADGLVQRLASSVHTDVQIALRRGDIRVPHDLFDHVDIAASSIQPGAKGMP